jgi:ABC-type iron transport system FetAB permease component
VDSLTLTYIIIGTAGVVGFACFAVLIFAPAWTAYGRTWERLAAAFLSVFVLAAFAGTGVVIGLVILWNWDPILELFGIQAAIAPGLVEAAVAGFSGV